jgi:hypothetical protein
VYASNKKIHVELNADAKNVIVRVLTMNGQVLSSQSFSNAASKITVDANNFTKGTYLVHVTNNHSQTAKAVMIF